MKVLVACEESQRTTLAFRSLGVEAFSCDLLPTSGLHPEWHIHDDVLNHLSGWDLIIAHPPCTYLSNAGARWLYPNGNLNEDRYKLGLAARDFFMIFFNLDCRVCIENPVPSSVFHLPKPDQIIEPFMFGEPYSKKTYLWLHGLPPLMPTQFVYPYKPFISTRSFSGFSRAGGSSISRSKTFEGISSAMALQWTDFMLSSS